MNTKPTGHLRHAFIKLHISIALAGFTGVLGKLITISEGMLVWYRMLLTFIMFWCIMRLRGHVPRVSLHDFTRMGGAGVLLCLHWLFFYGSIKASNISIGVVCFALVGFFSAILEPLIMRRRFSWRELSFSVLTVVGIACIFSFDMRYRLGIGIGIISSFFAALYTVTSKRFCTAYPTSTMLLYAMLGGTLFLSCLLPIYIKFFGITYIWPVALDWFWLFLLAFFCTVVMCFLQIQVLKDISAFTVNLSYNLEPVYSIAVAIVFFNEGRELDGSFYVGLTLIILSVALQSWAVVRQQQKIFKST